MKNFIICVPTKDRPEAFKKFLACHYDEKYSYAATIEQQDQKKYSHIIKNYSKINFLLIKNNLGLGYCRNILANFSLKNNYSYAFFSDDNASFDINKIEDFIKTISHDSNIVWLGAYNKIYDLFFNTKDLPKDAVFSAKFANAVYCIRTSIFKTENFDVCLKYQEDNEFNLRLKKKFYPQNPIFVYKGFNYSKRRHEPGGAMVLKNEIIMSECVNYINSKYGIEVMKFDEKRKDIRVYWVRFLQYLKNER